MLPKEFFKLNISENKLAIAKEFPTVFTNPEKLKNLYINAIVNEEIYKAQQAEFDTYFEELAKAYKIALSKETAYAG